MLKIVAKLLMAKLHKRHCISGNNKKIKIYWCNACVLVRCK